MATAANPQDQILSWFGTRHPITINLVGEYAGSSPFLIDGDSLLRHVFSDSRVDFATGFQILHATYVAEQFLESLRRRNCVFDVVFFEQHRKICTPAWNAEGVWKYQFAREVMIKHFTSLDRDGEKFVWKFETTNDAAFEAWLNHREPLFVMAHDGEDILVELGDGGSEDASEVAVQDEENDGTANEWEVKTMIYRLMHMGKGFNIALINSVAFADSKIFSRVIEAGLRRADVESGVGLISTEFVASISAPTKQEPPEPMDIALPSTISSARERLTVYTLIRLFQSIETLSEKTVALTSAYILHTAYLNHLSLEERHFTASSEALQNIKQESDVDNFLTWFYAEATKVLENDLVTLDGTVHLCDFVDGRLLLKLLAGKVDIPEAVSQDFERLAAVVKEGVSRDLDISISNSALGSVSPVESSQEVSTRPVTAPILPFSNPLFDKHLETIQIDVDVLSDDNEFDSQVTRDQYRPHKAKKPFKESVKPEGPVNGGRTVERKPMLNKGGRGQPDDKMEKRAQGRLRKWEQVYLGQMQRYAASLTDSVDGSLHQKLIICEEGGNKSKKQIQEKVKAEKGRPGKVGKSAAKDEEKPPTNTKPGKQVKGGKKEQIGKKAPVLSKADKIKLENAEKAVLKEAKALTTSWKNLCVELKVARDEENIISRLDEHIKKLLKDVPKKAADEHEGRFIEVEVRLYKIWTLQKMWIRLCKAGEKQKGYNTVAVLFDEARKALQSPALTTTVKAIIQNVFAGLDIAVPPAKPTVATKRAVSFTTWNGKVEGDDSRLEMSSEEFQLTYFGPYMDRNMDSAPDDRVPFEPDGWQRKVLDEIDGDNSVFVVAPTSAGKTFISFHAMEKVMKADDSGILVYIAPTKALVNQIAAEVISRFRKNYRHAGKTVWAIHTGDYQTNNPTECQILITVPSILSTMLMSPTNAKNWAPRVKRIIFDEVHSIGNAEDGVVWEQLLLLAPCPIIALSATVGNPDEFSEWLKTTQSSLGIKLSMIQHPHRYSDLRKFIYHPPKSLGSGEDRFQGLRKMVKYGQIDGTLGLEVIHPVSALVDPTHGMPDDLALEPGDSLRLYQAMKKASTPEYPVHAELDYRKVFGITGSVIKKADTILWEASLKSVLKQWMQDPESPFSKVVEMLQTKTQADEDKVDVSAAAEAVKLEKILDETKFAGEAYEHGDVVTLTHLRQKTLPLLASLHAANALPALVFSYSRSLCEYICLQVVTQLKEAEDHFRETDPRWKAKIKEWEAYLERKKRMGSKMRKAKPDDGGTKLDMARDQADVESSVLDSFNPEDPLPEFSFGDFKRYSKTEWESDLRDLEKWDVPQELVDAFKRGIGVHHSGLNRKYRQAVETLFRKGYMRLIIATGTLAMGINMPCKTVVFAGDNISLTALNYRQAAGRAGRRGFDLLGNVIFHGLPLDSAHRLISSRLPKLMGHFPMSTSLVLRLFILLHNSKDSEHAKATINTLLNQPRLVIGGDSFKEQVLHHLRFSIEFLRRQKLLGPSGNPLNFAGLAGHLYYTEKSAFAFHVLLCSGFLGRLCEGFVTADQLKKEKICEDLMLVMCNLFGRRRASRRKRDVRLLPPLPREARDLFADRNEDTLKTYSTYVETFARQYCSATKDHMLPFSKKSAGGLGLGAPESGNVARSSFVALSGHTDNFSDIGDLASSLRADIFLEGAAVPYLPVDDVRLNPYLFDFYKHGDVKRLAKENGVMAGDVWFVLKDFSVVLATITAGLLSYIRDGPGAYFNADRIMVKDEDGDMPNEDEEDEEDIDDDTIVEVEYDSDGEEMEKTEEPDKEDEREMREESKRRVREIVCVLRTMRAVQVSFEEKFRAMWA